MAESLSSGIEELNLNNDWETYCREQSTRNDMIRRFGTFGFKRMWKMKKLEAYILASEKTNTTLHKEVDERIAKYPDKDPYFYLPYDDEIGMDMLKSEKSLRAFIETLQWLVCRNEKLELMLLLYRNSNFLTLYFAMHEAGCLDVLFHLMQIDPDRYCLPTMANGIDWDVWLRTYPLCVKSSLEEATTVGFHISSTNKEQYAQLREDLAIKYQLNIDIKEQNPWHLGKLFDSLQNFAGAI